MKRLIIGIFFMLFLASCTAIKYTNFNTTADQKKIKKLSAMLYEISANKEESKKLAKIAVIHSKKLANKYNLVSPPLYHNFLVNSGKREKGLCYDFVDDLMKEINKYHFSSFRFRWGRANANQLDEHNVIVVLGDRESRFEKGVILDAWRNSGELFFIKLKEDPKYNFKPWKEGDSRININ